jgi:hypothetical protein
MSGFIICLLAQRIKILFISIEYTKPQKPSKIFPQTQKRGLSLLEHLKKLAKKKLHYLSLLWEATVMEKVEYEYTLGRISGTLRRRVKSTEKRSRDFWLYNVKNNCWSKGESKHMVSPEEGFKWHLQNPISEEEAFLWIINQSTNTQ